MVVAVISRIFYFIPLFVGFFFISQLTESFSFTLSWFYHRSDKTRTSKHFMFIYCPFKFINLHDDWEYFIILLYRTRHPSITCNIVQYWAAILIHKYKLLSYRTNFSFFLPSSCKLFIANIITVNYLFYGNLIPKVWTIDKGNKIYL
jgi:hypothetical protein